MQWTGVCEDLLQVEVLELDRQRHTKRTLGIIKLIFGVTLTGTDPSLFSCVRTD